MKKVINKKEFGRMVAILYGSIAMMSLTALTACSDMDEIVYEGNADNVENYVTPPTQPTVDAREVLISGKTYVFSGNYTGESKALTDRVVMPAASLQETDVKNIIIHDSRIPSLTNAETASLLLQMSHSAALVVADPTAANMKVLAKRLHGVINTYSIGGNNEVANREVNQILGSRILDRILKWNDGTINAVFGNQQNQDNSMSLFVIRDEDSYVVTREPNRETETMPVLIYDENGNVTDETTVSYVDDSMMNDYQYGIKADHLAEWLNTPDDDPVARESSRRVAAKMMATRAGGSAEEYLDKISESTDFILPVGFQLSGPANHSSYHECKVIYRVWSAYSTEKKCDVYCITQEITAYNQMLGCGPTKEGDWYDGSNWSAMNALSKKVLFLAKDVYGPYMKKVSSECVLMDGNHPVTLEQYAPQNSSSGGQNVSNGFSFSLGASASVKSSGPEAGISSSMQWSHSVSKFDADLTMKATASPDGKISWSYTGSDPDSHYRPFDNYHESARSILVNTCTLEQAWVWTVKGSTSSSVNFKTSVYLKDNWLTYAIGTLECIPHYISQDNSCVGNYVISCPPRFHQTWSMSVESDDVSADKLKEIEDFLTSRFDDYFKPSCVFSTYKPDHKRATCVADYDEIGTFVKKCKDAYNSETGRELLRQAGKRALLSDTGNYTIVWRQTDLGVNSDREEFTFHMNVK